MNSPPAAAHPAPLLSAALTRIGVVAINAGNTNLGDEAVLSGALQVIRTRVGNPDITVFAVNPQATTEHHQVAAAPLPFASTGRPAGRPVRRVAHKIWHPVSGNPVLAPVGRWGVRVGRAAVNVIRWPVSITRFALSMRGTDVMILAGSNQLEDSPPGGAGGYPLMILLCTALARLGGARVAFMSVGAGPLRSRFSQWMCIAALRLTTYASFRDAGSLELMRQMGYRGHGTVVPDLAYAPELPEPSMRPKRTHVRVAVNVFPLHDPLYEPGVSDRGKAFSAYADALADFIIAVDAQGMEVVLFGTQRSDERALDLVQERIHARAPGLGDLEQRMPTSYEDLTDIIEGSDAVVATRYHGILIGTLYGLPTIGVCYEAKSRRLLEMAGIGQFGVDANSLRAEELLDRLTAALRRGSLPEHIRERAEAMHLECRRGSVEALERCLPGLVAASGT